MGWIRGRILGEGSYGLVNIARAGGGDEDTSGLPPVFVVKSASFTNADSLIEENKILDELQKLNCPYIIRSFGSDTTVEGGETFFNLLLEFAAGGSLNDLIQTSRVRGLPDNFIRHCIRSIVIALGQIHQLGYVHCDVKPHNILLFGKGGYGLLQTAKLADFGSAKRIDSREEMKGDVDNNPLVRGTLIYAAPESVSRQEYLPESDVWGLGCTVFKMLTGKPPWDFPGSASPEEVARRIGQCNNVPQLPRSWKVSSKAKDFPFLQTAESAPPTGNRFRSILSFFSR